MSEDSDTEDKRLTAKRAYELTEEKGLMGREVAVMYDVSDSWVSRLKNEYAETRETEREAGRKSVSPSDFSTEELQDALNDQKEDDDEYECWNCDATFEYMEYDNCPKCNKELPWEEVTP